MKALKKPLSLLMALLMCFGVFAGTGVTAFAAGETMTTYMVDIPRASDPNQGDGATRTCALWVVGRLLPGQDLRTHPGRFHGRAIYCIEPGIGVETGDQYGAGARISGTTIRPLEPHHSAQHHQGIYRADHDLRLAGQRRYFVEQQQSR